MPEDLLSQRRSLGGRLGRVGRAAVWDEPLVRLEEALRCVDDAHALMTARLEALGLGKDAAATAFARARANRLQGPRVHGDEQFAAVARSWRHALGLVAHLHASCQHETLRAYAWYPRPDDGSTRRAELVNAAVVTAAVLITAPPVRDRRRGDTLARAEAISRQLGLLLRSLAEEAGRTDLGTIADEARRTGTLSTPLQGATDVVDALHALSLGGRCEKHRRARDRNRRRR